MIRAHYYESNKIWYEFVKTKEQVFIIEGSM